MKARKTSLVVPTSTKYFKVNIPEKGDHWFKSPYYGVGTTLTLLAGKNRVPENDERSELQKLTEMLPFTCAMIGAAWSHLDLELEAKFPLDDMSDDKILEFGNKVSEELQDADYNLLQILEMFNGVAAELARHQSILRMAQERAVFMEAPPVV